MRVGLNARRLAGQRLGVGRYIEYLAKYWNELADPGDRVSLYLPETPAGNGLPTSRSFQPEVLQSPLKGVLWENVVLPRRARDVDVLFCPSYTAPLRYDRPCVVAIHSVNEIRDGTHSWSYRLTYSPLYRLSAQRATRVIAPSESTRHDLEALYGIPASKIDVVPQGADESFQPLADERRLGEARRKYLGEDRPYILFVGKLSQRRNIPLLLEAFSLLKARHRVPHRLLLFGPNYLSLPLEQLTARLGIQDSVVQTDGRVSDHRELVAIYNGADLYVNASLYEGFSLTLVEALSCGVPVVTVNRGALAEIAGDAALLVDEPRADRLAEAMARALADPALRDELRARGVERARHFRWRDTARQTWDILRDVAAR